MKSAKNQFVALTFPLVPAHNTVRIKQPKERKTEQESSTYGGAACSVQLQLRHEQHINKVLGASEALTSWRLSAH